MSAYKRIAFFSGALTALGCGSGNVDSTAGTSNESVDEARVYPDNRVSVLQSTSTTSLTLRANVENSVSLHVLPSAVCTLSPEAGNVSVRGMQLASDENGSLSFSVRPNADGIVERLSLSCTNGSGAATTSPQPAPSSP